jgi:hypothetical protein
MGFFDNAKQNREKDKKAKEKVERLRQAKRVREGKDKMDPELANDLNLIQKSYGYKGERGWF